MVQDFSHQQFPNCQIVKSCDLYLRESHHWQLRWSTHLTGEDCEYGAGYSWPWKLSIVLFFCLFALKWWLSCFPVGKHCSSFRWRFNFIVFWRLKIMLHQNSVPSLVCLVRYFMNASTGKTQWTRPDEDVTWVWSNSGLGNASKMTT